MMHLSREGFLPAQRRAFTVVELVVVVMILGLLALMAIPTFGKYSTAVVASARENKQTATSVISETYPNARVIEATSFSRYSAQFSAKIDFGDGEQWCKFQQRTLISCAKGIPQR